MLSPPSRMCSLTATRVMSGMSPDAPGRSANKLKSEVPPPTSTIKTCRGLALCASPAHNGSAELCLSSQQ